MNILRLLSFLAVEVTHNELEPASSDSPRLHGLPHLWPGYSSSGTLPAQTWEVRTSTVTNSDWCTSYRTYIMSHISQNSKYYWGFISVFSNKVQATLNQSTLYLSLWKECLFIICWMYVFYFLLQFLPDVFQHNQLKLSSFLSMSQKCC